MPVAREATAATEEDLPDIYYIIFDRYANATSLAEFYNFDNSEFLEDLTDKGFYVASQSCANYPKTCLSLASSLNMTYLAHLTATAGPDSSDKTVVYPMLHDYRVWRYLKAKSYRFVHLGSWWGRTQTNPFADVCFGYSYCGLRLNEFSGWLLSNTIFAPIFPAVSRSRGESEVVSSPMRADILRKFEQLATLPTMAGPKFVFARLMIPHPPFLFGPNGEAVTKEEVAAWTPEENYVNQLIFTNRKMICWWTNCWQVRAVRQ